MYRYGILDGAEPGTSVTETLTIGIDEVLVSIEVADPIAVNYCTDALSEREVHETWYATSGTVVLTADIPESEWEPAILDVQLVDIAFVDLESNTLDLPDLTLTDVSIIRSWGG